VGGTPTLHPPCLVPCQQLALCHFGCSRAFVHLVEGMIQVPAPIRCRAFVSTTSWGGVGWGGWGKNVLALAYSILYTFLGPTSYTWGGVGLNWVGAVMFVHLHSISISWCYVYACGAQGADNHFGNPKWPLTHGVHGTKFHPSNMWIPLAKIRS
jgi:hypothetical protein